MHELSVALGIADVAARHAPGGRVRSVRVVVGRGRQVSRPALEFAWEAATQDTPLAGAALEVVEVAVRGRCTACGAEAEQAGFPLVCPACGGLGVAVVAGNELLVDSLDMEEEPGCIATR